MTFRLLRLPILVWAFASLLAADDWLAKFDRECRAKGGNPEHYSSGGGKCVMPATSSSASSSTYSNANNPYQPMVDGLLKWIFSPNTNAAAAKQRREAMLRELEAQREQARRNQQQAQADRLSAIMQRLVGDSDLILKGMTGTGDLRLKLGGPQRPLGMEVYQHPDDGKKRMGISGLSGINLDNETPTTTRAQLTLKIGDDATRSLQAAPAASAPQKTPAPADNTAKDEQSEAKAQVEELAHVIGQLSPEEQKKLLAALQNAEGPDPANAPAVTGEPTSSQKPGLSLKLNGAQADADGLKAAAESGGSPEELSKKAADQFRNLQGITTDPIKIGKSDADMSSNGARLNGAPTPTTVSGGATLPSKATPADRTGETSATDCNRPSAHSDPSIVDLRCAKQPLVIDPAKVQPDEVPRPAPVVAPVASDLQLLFQEKSRWPGPRRPDEPFTNPLREEEIHHIEAQLKKRNAEAALSTLYVVAMGGSVSPLYRERLAGHFLPIEQKLRYDTNAEFKAQVDHKIDEAVREMKRDWAASDQKAYDEAALAILPIVHQLYPKGLPSLAQLSPQFQAERDRIQLDLNRRMLQNAQDAPVQLMIRLDLAFMGLGK